MPSPEHHAPLSGIVRVELEHLRELASQLSRVVAAEPFTNDWWQARFAAKALYARPPVAAAASSDQIDRLLRFYRQAAVVGASHLEDRATRNDVRQALVRRHTIEAECAPPSSLYYQGANR